MAVSPDMIFAKAFRWLPRRPVYFLSAVWTGSQIAAFSLLIPEFFASGFRFSPEFLQLMFLSPLLLATGWLCPNIIVLAVALARFSRIENLSIRAWGIFAGVESVFCLLPVLGWAWTGGASDLAITLGVWLVQIVMLAAGVWFFHQWRMNHWAGELAMLRAGNASHLAELEERRKKERFG